MKSKNSILAAIFVMILITVFNFVISQTNLFQEAGININTVKVLVATEDIHKNQSITNQNTAVAYVNVNDVLTNSLGEYSTYILTDMTQVEQNNLIASQNIMKGEQIPVTRYVTIEENMQDYKNMKVFPIPGGYDISAGNSLYKGDEAELWVKYLDPTKDAKNPEYIIEKFMETEIKPGQKEEEVSDAITIVKMKDGDGLEVNTNRNLPSVIPSRIFIYATEDQIKDIIYYRDIYNAEFFFVKAAY